MELEKSEPAFRRAYMIEKNKFSTEHMHKIVKYMDYGDLAGVIF